jgi:hypothetical protein
MERNEIKSGDVVVISGKTHTVKRGKDRIHIDRAGLRIELELPDDEEGRRVVGNAIRKLYIYKIEGKSYKPLVKDGVEIDGT